MHALNIIDCFVKRNIINARDFSWTSQLRFCWLRELDNLYVKHYSGKLQSVFLTPKLQIRVICIFEFKSHSFYLIPIQYLFIAQLMIFSRVAWVFNLLIKHCT